PLSDWKLTLAFLRFTLMFAPDYSQDDVARVGPIIESLLHSGRLTDNERDAVDLCCRAAADLAAIRHSEIAKDFYARPDIQTRSADTVAAWLRDNPTAKPGTTVPVMGRMHVATYSRDGRLELVPFLE
ncbi:hypothetical protein LOC71_18770, partial [Rhodopirellula sp. JC740]